MKRVALIAIGAGLVAGCAMSAEGLGKSDVESRYTSAKPAQQVANCVAARLIGNNSSYEEAPGHWVVLRRSGYGVPYVRWDVFDVPAGGSRIEFRKSVGIMSGEEKATSCF